MKNLLFIFLLFISLDSFAQTEIKSSEAKNYMGKEVIVKAQVGGVRASTGEGKPNYINLGADYPNQDLTIVVFVNFEEKHKLNLESLKGKTIQVKGVVSEYKGRLQIKEPVVLKRIEEN